MRIALAAALCLFGPASALAHDDDAQTFCAAIQEPARERRYAFLRADLDELRVEIEARMKALETRRAEHEAWLRRREAFMDRARDGLVAIYARMRADAAAERLMLVEPMLAAAIMVKMKPGTAGQILNEMDRDEAARLSALIGHAGDVQ